MSKYFVYILVTKWKTTKVIYSFSYNLLTYMNNLKENKKNTHHIVYDMPELPTTDKLHFCMVVYNFATQSI